ncbi:MAG: PilZ domain-containing protein [Lachnospiraceae bacterium]
MIATELKLGQPIEIQLERDGYVYRLASKVEATGRDKIYITLITAASRVFRFDPEDKVTIIYRTKERIWSWSDVKGGAELLDGRRVHVLYVKGEAESYNRREAYRVPIGKVCELTHHRYLSETVKNLLVDQINKKFRAIIKDISENGVAVVSTEELQIGDYLDFEFEAGGLVISCEAKVVRSMPLEDSKIKRVYGCVLTKANKELSKFVIDTQRKQLQNLRSGR